MSWLWVETLQARKEWNNIFKAMKRKNLQLRMVQYLQINQCDTPYSKLKSKNHDYFNRCRKAFNKIQHLFMIKTTQQSSVNITQHKKGHIWQAHN